MTDSTLPRRPRPGSGNVFVDWRGALAVAVAASASLLAACGGGGEMASPAAPGATAASYSQGPIDGFGSIIVGGVRYDDSAATVADDDGVAHDRTALKLGMMVQVDAGTVDRSAATSVAQRVRFGSEVVGPVAARDTAASTLQVLGQTVVVTASTVFDAAISGGLAGLGVGTVVEVHGILDTTSGRITATRIEPEPAAPAYRLRGVVAALDTGAKTFRIGTALISYAGLGASALPAGLANGQTVRVQLQTVQVGGAWVATAIRGGARLPEATRDARVEGLITVFTSSASFEINGLKVDASAATFPDGSAAVVLGARVEVSGSVSNGVLVATSVAVEERRDHGLRPLELHGTLSALDTTAKTFVLRGITVSYAGSVAFGSGSAADLANGKQVEVRGVLAADRTRLAATRIEFNS